MKLTNLTKQEKRVAYLTAMGYSQKEIASKLFIQQGTVHSHQKNIRKKSGAKNIADVTRMYIIAYPQQFALALILAFTSLFASIDLDNTMHRTRSAKQHRVYRTAKRGRSRKLIGSFFYS